MFREGYLQNDKRIFNKIIDKMAIRSRMSQKSQPHLIRSALFFLRLDTTCTIVINKVFITVCMETQKVFIM